MILKDIDPTSQPSFSLGNRLARLTWSLVYVFLFRPSPRPLHAWRAFLLRCFGAKVGAGCHVYGKARIWAPWNLELGERVGVADDAILYSMGPIVLGDYAVVSQGAHLCAGSHDYNSPNFQLYAKPIRVGAKAWICAEAFVLPGVEIPEGAVIGARAVVPKSLAEPWAVYAGHPCVKVAERNKH